MCYSGELVHYACLCSDSKYHQLKPNSSLWSSTASFVCLNDDDVWWVIDDLQVSSGQFSTDHKCSKNSGEYIVILWCYQNITCSIYCSWCPSSSPHSAAVYAKDIRSTLVNGEHRLIWPCDRISHHLCLLVCCSIDCYRSPILPPSDSGSRPTSGGAGEGLGSLIIEQCSSCWLSWKGWILLAVVNFKLHV